MTTKQAQRSSLHDRFKNLASDNKSRKFYSYKLGKCGFEGYMMIHPHIRQETIENYELNKADKKLSDESKQRITTITLNQDDADIMSIIEDSEYADGNKQQQRKLFSQNKTWKESKDACLFKTILVALDKEKKAAGFSVLEIYISDQNARNRENVGISVGLAMFLVKDKMQGQGFGLDLSMATRDLADWVLTDIYTKLLDYKYISTYYAAEFDSLSGAHISDYIEGGVDSAREYFKDWLNDDYRKRGGTTPPEVKKLVTETGF